MTIEEQQAEIIRVTTERCLNGCLIEGPPQHTTILDPDRIAQFKAANAYPKET